MQKQSSAQADVLRHQRATDQRRREALYDVAGAAEYLGVHPMTVRRWIAAGRLPAQRVGIRPLIRIRAEDLLAFASTALS